MGEVHAACAGLEPDGQPRAFSKSTYTGLA